MFPDHGAPGCCPNSLFLPPSEILTSEFFQLPMFPVATMYEISKLYRCNEVEYDVLKELKLSQLEKKYRIVTNLVWFSLALDHDSDAMRHIINHCKKLRKKVNVQFQAEAPTHMSGTLTLVITTPVKGPVPVSIPSRDATAPVALVEMVKNVPVRDPPNLSQPLQGETYVDRNNYPDIRKAGCVFQNFKD